MRREVELASQPQAVCRVTCFQFRVQLMGRLEEGDAQRPPIALEAVPQGRERSVRVHPLAQIAEDLLAGSWPVQRFQLGPVFRLCLADEGQDRFWKDRPFAVETVWRNCYIAGRQEVGLDDGFEGDFSDDVGFHVRISAPPRLLSVCPAPTDS